MSATAHRSLRKIRPSDQLLRRRLAGASLRELAPDAGASHQALSPFFKRPEVVARMRSLERVERQTGAERRRDHAAGKATDPPGDPANRPERGRRRRSPHEEWLDTPKNLSAAVAFTQGLIFGHRADGLPYAAESWQVEALLAEGWTPDA